MQTGRDCLGCILYDMCACWVCPECHSQDCLECLSHDLYINSSTDALMCWLPVAAACFCWVQIIVLILSQDTSFSHNIHKVMLPGNISWYRERMLQKLSLGSLVFIVLLRCDDSPTTGSACMIRWSYGLRLWKPDHWSQCYVESCAKAVTLCDIPAGTCDAELPTAMLASYKICIYQQTHWLL